MSWKISEFRIYTSLLEGVEKNASSVKLFKATYKLWLKWIFNCMTSLYIIDGKKIFAKIPLAICEYREDEECASYI